MELYLSCKWDGHRRSGYATDDDPGYRLNAAQMPPGSGRLISIALVDSNGRLLYLQAPFERKQISSAHARRDLLPNLTAAGFGLPDPKVCDTLDLLGLELSRFLRVYERPLIVANWPEDVAHFMECLLQTDPDVRVMTPDMKIVLLSSASEPSRVPGNAAHDAMALMRSCRNLSPQAEADIAAIEAQEAAELEARKKRQGISDN